MKIRLFSKQSPKSNTRPPLSPKRPQSKRSRARYGSRLRTFAVRSLSQKSSNNRKPLRPRIHHRLTQILSISIAAAITLSSTIGTVFAIDNATLEKYGINGVYWYDATGGDDCLPITNGGNVTIIGDSITVASENAIKEAIPQAEIYAQVSKQFGKASDDPIAPTAESINPSGISIAKYLMAENKVQNTVVFALGTNSPGAVSDEDINTLLELFGNDRTIFFVTNFTTDPHSRDYQEKYTLNNERFEAAAENANVQVIDWAGAISSDPHKYLNSDGIHPNSEGQKLWADLISKAVGGPGSMTAGGNGNYTNYAGDKVLTETQIEQLEANIPIYNQAIAETGAGEYRITWQLVAAIHYKETGLSRYNPKNGQGVYQLYSYTGGGKNRNAFPAASSISADEFLRQTKIMLKEDLIPKVIGGLNLGNDEDIKSLFFGYNGRSSHYIDKALAMGFNKEQANSGEGSPYVMNRYDAQRDPNSSEMNPNWPGMYVADGEYSPTATTQTFGGYTVYKAIGGASACGGSISSGGLNFEQSKKLLYNYIYDVNCTDWLIPARCNGTSGGGKANCVTFVMYFLSRFTSADPRKFLLSDRTGHGGSIVSNMTGTDVEANGKTFRVTESYDTSLFEFGGFEPRPFAVFSTEENASAICDGHKCGHTGVVLGINKEADEIYIGQVGYGSSLTAPWILQVVYSLSEYSSGKYWYAYTDKVVNQNAINEFLNSN